MNRFSREFDRIQFTDQEKKALAARLERAAEQAESMDRSIGRKAKKAGRGLIIGIAAACLLTAGALAATFNSGLLGMFQIETTQAQEVLEEGIYRLNQSEKADGWTFTLAECMGDDRLFYLWVDVAVPDASLVEPPEEWMDLELEWHMDLQPGGGERSGWPELERWDPETGTASFLISIPTDQSMMGETVSLTLGPLLWDGCDPDRGGERVIQAVWGNQVTFREVTLDYPDQTIRLTPNLEVPYLDGAATLTRLEISPLQAMVKVEGGSCAGHHRADYENHSGQEEGTVIPSEGGDFTITVGGAFAPLDCWGALEVELHMKDGSVIIPTTASWSSCQDGYENPDFTGVPFVERRLEYREDQTWGDLRRVIDPAQVDHVTVCGVDVPVSSEESGAQSAF